MKFLVQNFHADRQTVATERITALAATNKRRLQIKCLSLCLYAFLSLRLCFCGLWAWLAINIRNYSVRQLLRSINFALLYALHRYYWSARR